MDLRTEKESLLREHLEENEVRLLLERLGEREFGGDPRPTVGAVIEATGADPIEVGRLLAQIRGEAVGRRFEAAFAQHAGELEEHEGRIEHLEDRASRLESLTKRRSVPAVPSQPLLEGNEPAKRLESPRSHAYEEFDLGRFWILAVGAVVLLGILLGLPDSEPPPSDPVFSTPFPEWRPPAVEAVPDPTPLEARLGSRR